MMFLPLYFVPVGSGTLLGILVGWAVGRLTGTGKPAILSGSFGGAIGAIGGMIVRAIYEASLPQSRPDEWGFHIPDPPAPFYIHWGIIFLVAILGSSLLASVAALFAKWRKVPQNLG